MKYLSLVLLATLTASAVEVSKSAECRSILDARNPNWMDGPFGVQFDFEMHNLIHKEGWADCNKIIEEAISRAVMRKRKSQ